MNQQFEKLKKAHDQLLAQHRLALRRLDQLESFQNKLHAELINFENVTKKLLADADELTYSEEFKDV